MDLLFADCDGAVAADVISLKGSALEQLTAGPDALFFEPRDYPGSESPKGCGENSHYQVTYSIDRLDAPKVRILSGGNDVTGRQILYIYRDELPEDESLSTSYTIAATNLAEPLTIHWSAIGGTVSSPDEPETDVTFQNITRFGPRAVRLQVTDANRVSIFRESDLVIRIVNRPGKPLGVS